MPLLSRETLRNDFDRIARTQRARVDQLDPYELDLLAHLPRLCVRVLDAGCGIGILSRALARRGAEVDAIDLSPEMISLARERTPSDAAITWRLDDLLTASLPADHYDAVVSVATIHHLPLVNVFCVLRNALRPGGRLLVLDLFASRGLWDRLHDAVGFVLSAPHAFRRRSDDETAAAWRAHGSHETLPTLDEVRAAARTHLPGARIRRRLRFRYELVWDKPRA